MVIPNIKLLKYSKIINIAIAFAWLSAILFTLWISYPHYYNITFSSIQHINGKVWRLEIDGLPEAMHYFFKIVDDRNDFYDTSYLILYENGTPLGPPHSKPEDIAAKGGGAYTHRDGSVFFSPQAYSQPELQAYTAKPVLLLIKKEILCANFLFIFLLTIFTLKFYSLDKIKVKCFLVIICLFTFVSFSYDSRHWFVFPDSKTYFNCEFSDSWKSIRTPGFAIYCQALGVEKIIYKFFYVDREQYDAKGKLIPIVNNAFNRIACANVVLYSIAFALLTYCLSFFFPIELSAFYVGICVLFGRLPHPSFILADPPACIMTIFFISSALLFLKTKQLTFLLLTSFCAVYSMLLKPAMAFLPLIVLIIILVYSCFLIYHKLYTRLLRTAIINIFLCSGTLLWPLLLYMQGGVLVPSQLSGVSNMMFAIYLLQPGDENIFANSPYKEFVKQLIQGKQESDNKLDQNIFPNGRQNYSKARIFLSSVNEYGWIMFHKVCRENNLNLSHKDENSLVKKIAPIIIRAHYIEYIETVFRSFASAFGFYKDLSISRLQKWYKFTFPVYLSLFFLILSQVCYGNKNFRIPLLFLASIHISSVLIHAIGHAVLVRYVEITEWSFFLCSLLAFYSLLIRFINIIKTKRH